MSLSVRIFRWADCPAEYRVTAEREWVAFVPDSKAFDADREAGWVDVVTAFVVGGTVQAGNARH
jgi:hypothetical protein